MLKSFIRTAVWSLVVVFALTNPVAAQQPKHSAEIDRAAEHVIAQVTRLRGT